MANCTDQPIQVFCVGNIVADIVPRPVVALPRPGELTLNDEIRISIGGCGATTAAALFYLGVPTQLLTAVGGDCLGDLAIAELRRIGLDTGQVMVCSEKGTSKNIILLVSGEDRRYIYTMGATAALRATDIDLDMVRLCRFLFVGSYLLIPNLNQEALVTVFRKARSAGVQTILDVATVRADGCRTSLDRLLPETDYFLPNYDEARIITGASDVCDQAMMFREMGAATVVIKCGAVGAMLACAEGLYRIGAYAVEEVDSTGAGDCFNAGFMSALIDGRTPIEALVRGSALGAACVQAIGGTANLLTATELDTYVTDHSLTVESINVHASGV